MSERNPHERPEPPWTPPLPVGSNRCHCTACGRSFGGVGGFDAHQRLNDGDLTCLDPATLGMVERGGWWVRETPHLANGVGRKATNGAEATSGVADPKERANGPTPLGEREVRHTAIAENVTPLASDHA